MDINISKEINVRPSSVSLHRVAALMALLSPPGVAIAADAPATSVSIWPVKPVPFATHIETIGQIEAFQGVTLSPELPGRITELDFDSGVSVKKGQLLLVLNDAPEQGELVREKGELLAAQADLKRAQTLIRTGVESHQDLETATARFQAAQGNVARLQAVIDQKHIRAPFDGAVGIRRVNLGQYLNPGDPIATLTSYARMRVNFILAEENAAFLRLGQTVRVTLDTDPGQTFNATVTAIDPQIDGSRTLSVQALLDHPPPDAHPGTYAHVSLTATVAPREVVPETAVTYSAYGETVFVAHPSGNGLVVNATAVRESDRRDGWVAIENGLKPGDRVVSSGQNRLADGMAVREIPEILPLTGLEGLAQ
jgi:multidrug efflux system membrane fusion protein